MQRQGHPHILTCTTNLAWTCAKLDDLDQAEKLVQEVFNSPKEAQSQGDNTIQKAENILRYIVMMREIFSETKVTHQKATFSRINVELVDPARRTSRG
jgi:polyhydroxyalkanoate synthesis regulator phasin